MNRPLPSLAAAPLLFGSPSVQEEALPSSLGASEPEGEKA